MCEYINDAIIQEDFSIEKPLDRKAVVYRVRHSLLSP